MASEYTTILATDSAFTIKRKKAIASLEGQKEYSGVWTDKEEKKLQTLKDELDTGQILPTLPGAGDETKRDGWIKNLLRSIFGAKEAGASTLYPEGGIGNYLPGQSTYPAGMSNAAWLQQQQPTSRFQTPSVTQASNVFQGGPPSVSSAESQAQLIAQEEARKAAAAAQAAAIAGGAAGASAPPTPTPRQPVSGPHGGGGGGQGGGGGGQAAGQRPSRTSRPSGYAAVRKYGRADGGMVSLMDLLNRRI